MVVPLWFAWLFLCDSHSCFFVICMVFLYDSPGCYLYDLHSCFFVIYVVDPFVIYMLITLWLPWWLHVNYFIVHVVTNLIATFGFTLQLLGYSYCCSLCDWLGYWFVIYFIITLWFISYSFVNHLVIYLIIHTVVSFVIHLVVFLVVHVVVGLWSLLYLTCHWP